MTYEHTSNAANTQKPEPQHTVESEGGADPLGIFIVGNSICMLLCDQLMVIIDICFLILCILKVDGKDLKYGPTNWTNFAMLISGIIVFSLVTLVRVVSSCVWCYNKFS
jgi:hypothetical protein